MWIPRPCLHAACLALLAGAAGCPRSFSGPVPTARTPGASVGVVARAATTSGEIVARVGQTTLSATDIEARMNAQSPFVRARFQDAAARREFVDNQVRFEVLAQEAMRRGLHEDEDVQDSLKKILVQKLTRQEFDGRVSLQDITDESLRTYYEEHSAEYNKPEMMRVSHVFLPFGADREAARRDAEKVRTLAADPARREDREAFKELVATYSKDLETQRTGGDLRYLSAAEVEERFGSAAREAIFAAETPFEVLPVVEGKAGYHVFKRMGRRKPIERTFEQVRNQIRNVVYRERRAEAFDAYVEELKQQLGVEIREEAVGRLQVQPGNATLELDGHEHGHDEPDHGEHGHEAGHSDPGHAQGHEGAGRASPRSAPPAAGGPEGALIVPGRGR